ncbi:MAG: nitroreductase family protein, partial [Clostridia bacterium]|nr:nitroreductase family protein [Clostridia bacterium]
MLKDLLIKNRSYRKYDESRKITADDLMELIDYTRYTASTVNFQALKFKPICNEKDNAVMFDS